MVGFIDDDLDLTEDGQLSPISGGGELATVAQWLQNHFTPENVQFYEDGKQLIKEIKANPFKFDWIIVDKSLKGIHHDGAELGKEILQIAPWISLVMFSRFEEFSDCLSAMENGFRYYLKKSKYIASSNVSKAEKEFRSDITRILELQGVKNDQKMKASQLALQQNWDTYIDGLKNRGIAWSAYPKALMLLAVNLYRDYNIKTSTVLNHLLPTLKKYCEESIWRKTTKNEEKFSFSRLQNCNNDDLANKWLKEIETFCNSSELLTYEQQKKLKELKHKTGQGTGIWTNSFIKKLRTDTEIRDKAALLLYIERDAFEVLINNVEEIKKISEKVQSQKIPQLSKANSI